jgi:hypothetical protein
VDVELVKVEEADAVGQRRHRALDGVRLALMVVDPAM